MTKKSENCADRYSDVVELVQERTTSSANGEGA